MPEPLSVDRAVEIYTRHSPGLSASRLHGLQSLAKRWAAAALPPDLAQIKTVHFADFRAYGIRQQLSPVTIEHYVSTLRAIMRMVGPETDECPHGLGLIDRVPWIGKRLARPPVIKSTVSLADLSAVYAVADLSSIPRRHIHPTLFWRAWLVTAYNTALRMSDLIGSLLWSNYDDRRRCLATVASKTGKQHELPVNEVLARHLAMLPRTGPKIFPVAPSSDNAIRVELRRLCQVAGVPPFTPQSIRRRSACEYDRIHGGAGGLILGHTLPNHVTYDSYVSPFEILTTAAGKLPQPTAFLGPQPAKSLTHDPSPNILPSARPH